MRKYFLVSFLFIIAFAKGRELDCTVTVNYDKITNANVQIFKNLQTSLNDFVNKTVWTEQSYSQREKINCSMYIIINSYDSNQFGATIQVQSSRPAYNSTYSSPVININDKDFNFRYVEFENMIYNPNSFDTNLISVIAFYSYLIIGTDADTFALKGGSPYFQVAQDIVNQAAQSGYKGWTQAEKNQNRFFLISDILSPALVAYRETLYSYHFDGIDIMHKDLKSAKEAIKNSLNNVYKLNAIRPNSYLTRTFFDAKVDEIVAIYTGGPSIPVSDLVDNLNKISPTNASKWSQVKF